MGVFGPSASDFVYFDSTSQRDLSATVRHSTFLPLTSGAPTPQTPMHPTTFPRASDDRGTLPDPPAQRATFTLTFFIEENS